MVEAVSADEGRDFDWAAVDVVVPEQAAIAVYVNPTGDVVVRQCGAWSDDADASIWFSPGHALAVAKAILAAAGLDAANIADLAPEPAQDATKPMASTAAARQKRYRQRKKKEPALFDSDESDVTRDAQDG